MPSWNEVEVIGFDLDNTLYKVTPEMNNIIQGYIHLASAEILGITVDEAQARFDHYYQGGKGLSGGKTLAAMGVVTDRDIVQDALEHADVASVLMPDQRTIELIRQLNSHFRSVDILTGSGNAQTYAKMAALGLKRTYFGQIITADDSDKSSGVAYRQWLDSYPDLSPQQFLYVGDRRGVDSDIPRALDIQTALINVTFDETYPVPQFPDLTSFGAAITTLRTEPHS